MVDVAHEIGRARKAVCEGTANDTQEALVHVANALGSVSAKVTDHTLRIRELRAELVQLEDVVLNKVTG